MNLYIVRHAWAGERDDRRWPDDDLRPLTEDGKERFAKFAAKLADRGMQPELIATSPLVRCLQTAELLAAAMGKAKIVELDALRPGRGLDELLEWTVRTAHQQERIAWVGHAPDVDRMSAALIDNGSALLRFAKGSAAAIRFDGPPAVAAGELQWLVTAKMLGC